MSRIRQEQRGIGATSGGSVMPSEPPPAWPGFRRLDSPGRVGMAASLAGAVFVALRTMVAGTGHVAALFLVGSAFADRRQLPRGVPVISGQGYDGQFYYRLALDPADFAERAFGIRLDSAERFGRILYPALAWLFAGGHAAAVPYSLLAVNVICLGLLAALGASLARRSHLHPAWGLALAAYAGFLWTLGRDLTELVAAVALVAGLLAIRAGRPVLAGLALAAAALGRETELMAAGCVLAADLACVLRRRFDATTAAGRAVRRLGASERTIGWQAWVTPFLVYGAWQLTVLAYTGRSPLKSSGSANLVPPLVGVVKGFSHYLGALPSTASLLWFGELGVLSLVAAAAGWFLWVWASSRKLTPGLATPLAVASTQGPTPPAPLSPGAAALPYGAATLEPGAAALPYGAVPAPASDRGAELTGSNGTGTGLASGVPLHERLLWVGAIVLVLCLAQGIWLGDVGFRSFDDVYLMSWIVVLGTGRRPALLAAVVGLTWVVAAVQLVRFL